MVRIFSLILLVCVNSAWGQDIPIPENYVQQNQHTAFFFVGENSLTSQCSLSVHDMDCLFQFEDDHGNKQQFRTPYEQLKVAHTQIVKSLKKLRDSWLIKYPFGGLKSVIFSTRDDDIAALEQMITELENEALPLRALQTKKDTRKEAAYIYSSQRAHEIYAVFQKHLDI